MKIASTRIPNRVVAPTAAPLVVPETPAERQAQYSRTLAAAIAFLESRITSGDVEAAERAVTMLFDLEKTRLRHAREIHGVPESKAKPTTAMLPPMEVHAPMVRSLRDRIDDTSEEKDSRSTGDAPASPAPSGDGVTGPQKGTPVVRSLRDRIDDVPKEKDSRKTGDAPASPAPSGHGVTGPHSESSHARTRAILLRRLAEVDPNRIWSDEEVDRMLAQLEVLHREQTGGTRETER